MHPLLLPIYRWRPFPRPSLVPPVEPEKSRAARAGLLHGRMNPNKVQKWAEVVLAGQELPQAARVGERDGAVGDRAEGRGANSALGQIDDADGLITGTEF